MRIPGDKTREEKVGVYAHIPFCSSKCPYCDFSSVAGSGPPEKGYVDCLLDELRAVLRGEGDALASRVLCSVYIGGGTPSLFSATSIGRLLEGVTGVLKPVEAMEVTIEVNPGSVTLEKMKGYRSAGVNRVSIGVQSFNGRELKILGRTHSPQKAAEAFHISREAGFENTGIDLIFGIPGQRPGDWEATLEKAVLLSPEHVSLYGLTIEEETPYGAIYRRRQTAGTLSAEVFTTQHAHGEDKSIPPSPLPPLPPLPSEDEEAQMYSSAVRAFSGRGYLHYEISNFSLPGYMSVHNRNYWRGVDYIGLGASAHSYLSYPLWGRRFWNERDPYRYMRLVKENGRATAGSEALKMEEALQESMMLGLRMLDCGLKGEIFRGRFNMGLEEAFKGPLQELIGEGLLETRGEDVLLTEKGVLISNEVFLRLLKART